MKTLLQGLKTLLCVIGLSIGSTVNAQDFVVLMNESFPTAAVPFNWTVMQEAGSDGWQFGVTDYTSSFYTIPAHPTGGSFTASNDDQCNCDMSNDQLITPVFDLSPFDSITVLFDYFYSGEYGSIGTLEVSSDGGATWVFVPLTASATWRIDIGLTLVNGDELVLGQGPYNFTNQMVFRFVHNDDASWADGLAVDNVLLAGFFQACDNTNEDGQWPTSSITPNANGSVTTISTNQYSGSEYAVITGVGAGRLYEFTHADGSYITVREGASNGPIVLNAGYSPLTVQTMSNADLYVHYTADEFCQIVSAGSWLTTVQDVTPTCDMSSEDGQWPALAITPDAGGAVTTISPSQYLGSEYSVLTGIAGGTYYELTHSGGAYITVREGAVAGPVVAQGFSPLQFTATSSSDFYVHWTADALCAVASSGSYTTTVQNLGTPPCDMSTADGQWPTSSITPNSNGSVTTISNDNYVGSEYSVITGVLAGHQYQFTHAAGSYITVRSGAAGGTVIGAGFSPLTVFASSTANLYVHWTVDGSCTVDGSGSHLTTVQDLGVPPCNNTSASGLFPSASITPDAGGAVTTISTNMYAGSEYSVITGVVAGEDYILSHAFVGSYVTVREGAVAGPVVAAGFSPLTVTATSSADLYVHWTADEFCATNANGSYLATVQLVVVLVCDATAGTLAADATPVMLVGGSAVISATEVVAPNVPSGFAVTYVLTSGAGLVIIDLAASPSFTVTAAGDYTIHTLVYDPADQATLLASTTGFDVNALLIQGGGSLCGALDVTGAPIVVEDELVGINEALNSNLMVYPNPNNGQFIVGLNDLEGKATLNIVDMMGRNVYSQVVTVNGTFRQSIDLNVAAGSYLLQVITDNGVATRKVELH